MFDIDKWQEIIDTLRKNKLRTLLTAAGVFWGILMLIAMLGFGRGFEEGVSTKFGGYAANTVWVWDHKTSMPYKGFQPGRDIQLRTGDIDALRALPGLQYVAPRLQLGGHRGGTNVVHDNKTGNFSIAGDYPEIQHITLMTQARGRFLNRYDIEQRRKVAVIGRHVYDVLFEPGTDPIGEHIKIGGVYFQIVGTFKARATGDQAARVEQTIHIPFSTFQQAFNMGDRVGWFALLAQPDRSAEQVEKEVRATLAARHSVHPDDDQAFGSFNAAKEFGKITTLFAGIQAFLWLVGTMTLLAGVLGVSNIMLIVVKERTREIGIRKALGATPWSITSLIIQESIALTALAGYAGVVIGVAGLEVAAAFMPEGGWMDGFFQRPIVDLGVVLVATTILVIAGAVAGIIPARHAAGIHPVVALRAE